jgi:hypothetical protein
VTIKIASPILRAGTAFLLAGVIAVGAREVLVEVPIGVMGTLQPWDYRSTDQHTTAFLIEAVTALLALAVWAALTRVFFRAWAPPRGLRGLDA